MPLKGAERRFTRARARARTAAVGRMHTRIVRNGFRFLQNPGRNGLSDSVTVGWNGPILSEFIHPQLTPMMLSRLSCRLSCNAPQLLACFLTAPLYKTRSVITVILLSDLEWALAPQVLRACSLATLFLHRKK